MAADGLRSEFERLCPSTPGLIGVAVSGGSDSIALLHFAADWAEGTGRELIAFTVDHGLRAEADDEAQWVAEQAAARSIMHRTLRWEAPVARQSAARRARHVLLAQAIKAVGGTRLMLGHTYDDQLETVLMRQRQRSTWYGLAGMSACAPSPVWPEGRGVIIMRPLLAQRREALRDRLRQIGQDWVEDPSNENLDFERVRVRQELKDDPNLSAEIEGMQVVAARRRKREDAAFGRFLINNVVIENAGRITVDLGTLGQEHMVRVLSLLLQIVGGKELPPRRRNLLSLAEKLATGPNFAGATLHGVIVKKTKGKTLLQPETDPLPYGPVLERFLTLTRHLSGNLCQFGD